MQCGLDVSEKDTASVFYSDDRSSEFFLKLGKYLPEYTAPSSRFVSR
jgi:hypothetical protein